MKRFFGYWSGLARKVIKVFLWLFLVGCAFRGGLELLAEQAPPHRRSHSEKLDNGCTLLFDGMDQKRYLICPDGMPSGSTISPLQEPENDEWGEATTVTFGQ